jgi:hypothetical protein
MVELIEAVKGDRLRALRSLRDQLAGEIVAGRVEKGISQTAQLAKQLRDTLREIEELEKRLPKESVVDELASKRKTRRRAGTAGVRTSDRGDG